MIPGRKITAYFQRHVAHAAAACMVLALAAAIAPAPAAAQYIVVGDNIGAACYRQAMQGRGTRVAIQDCDRALSFGMMSRRDTAATHINRAIVLIHAGLYERALADVDASRRHHDFAEVFVTRGAVFHYLRRYPEAVEQATLALERKDLGEPAKAYYNRAVSYEAMDRIEEAYYDYLRASELEPEWALPREELTRFVVLPADAPDPSGNS